MPKHSHKLQGAGRKTWNPSHIYYSDKGSILIRGSSEARGTETASKKGGGRGRERRGEGRMLRRKMEIHEDDEVCPNAGGKDEILLGKSHLEIYRIHDQ